MRKREAAIRRFLDAQGWGGAVRSPLAGDASFRRYERLVIGERRAVLMDAPPSHEDVRPFVAVDRLLRGMGYSAPEIFAADVDEGLLLLEDLGDEIYTRVLGRGDPVQERALYGLAVDLLIDLHRRPIAQAAAGLPDYDDARFLAEAALLLDWYLPAIRGEETGEALRAEYLALWPPLLAQARRAAPSLVLRDYHVDNLVWLPEREGIAACGLLDFQDAVRGPTAYDLVSLLEDARRDLPPSLVAEMKARYVASVAPAARAVFEAAYAILGAQRNCKIIGIFTRLCLRDGKPAYLAHIPRVWRLLEGDLAHPVLAPVAAFLDKHIPKRARAIPPRENAA